MGAAVIIQPGVTDERGTRVGGSDDAVGRVGGGGEWRWGIVDGLLVIRYIARCIIPSPGLPLLH